MTIKIISFNANGIRSSATKGFFNWLAQEDPDVLCLQETKAQPEQLLELSKDLFFPKKYHCYYFSAVKKGYSGVAVFSKIKPLKVSYGLGWEVADHEGRYLQLDFANNLSIASIYMPSGTSGDIRQAIKYQFLANFEKFLKKILKAKKKLILCGDINIAHKQIDLKNWRANQKHSGFLPEERAWLDKIFTNLGYIDGFRAVNQEPDQYTWWSHRGNARKNNVGWRIDYQIVTANLEKFIVAAKIYNKQKFSDHAPLIMDYSIKL